MGFGQRRRQTEIKCTPECTPLNKKAPYLTYEAILVAGTGLEPVTFGL